MLTQSILLPVFYFVFAEVDRLRVHSEPAVAVLTMQQRGRNLVNLPDLEFRLSVSTHCAQSGRPESLSITIADSRKTLRGEALQSTVPIDVSMRIPASQLAPFALREFCVDSASEAESVFLTAALAAQLSLRCSRVEKQSVVFAAEPLDIRVDCIPFAEETVPALD